MGKVKPRYIKSIAQKLLEMYPDKFSDRFEDNKKAVAELADLRSKSVRNKVAGYITRLVKAEKAKEQKQVSAEAAP
ncbi:MAG: 30S ribosomal protein S17e [Thermoproteus sp. AZ2]|jgi:small subunit ribosomal protein S17e|uniref:30S ribosomal protein S17e n=1 Tax=Thermoproteus sp. AZ2 TaxID=1609232 RepID=A0ACC6V283_9CREN|nr:MAG: 30S ribosomal protein S17e [Thermoproteus sp. AZ2]